MPVISAPESVVGTAATRAPLTAATALAVSIVRPPPRATSCRRLRPLEQDGGGLRHLAGGYGVDRPGSRLQLRRAGQGTWRRHELEAGEAVLVEEPRRLRDAVAPEHDDPASVPPDEAAVHPGFCSATRGLTTGRRFGSTSARRCS